MARAVFFLRHPGVIDLRQSCPRRPPFSDDRRRRLSRTSTSTLTCSPSLQNLNPSRRGLSWANSRKASNGRRICRFMRSPEHAGSVRPECSIRTRLAQVAAGTRKVASSRPVRVSVSSSLSERRSRSCWPSTCIFTGRSLQGLQGYWRCQADGGRRRARGSRWHRAGQADGAAPAGLRYRPANAKGGRLGAARRQCGTAVAHRRNEARKPPARIAPACAAKMREAGACRRAPPAADDRNAVGRRRTVQQAVPAPGERR